MKAGFYTIMAAQFFSSLADNALLIAAIRLLQEMHEPDWMQPSLQQSFVVFYVVLAPLVGESRPRLGEPVAPGIQRHPPGQDAGARA